MNKLNDFIKAVDNLEQVLALQPDEFIRDSAIKRFEITFDLAWKTIKEYLRERGVECYTPRDALKNAFEIKLIDHNILWLEMIKDRNEGIHIYNEKLAQTIYEKLPQYLEILKLLRKSLQ